MEWFEETEKAILDADPVSSEPEVLRVQLRDHKVTKLVYCFSDFWNFYFFLILFFIYPLWMDIVVY